MRAYPAALVGILAAAGLGACGGSQPSLCRTYTSTCTASCLDGSAPRFTATSDCTLIAPEYFDPRGAFCTPEPAPSKAAMTCPGQATSAGTYDCTACSVPLVAECACPDFHGPF